jgi:CIC family chloride channel protein
MAGGFFGTVVHGIFPEVTAPPDAYGIVGMGAVVGGTTHGPLTAMLILFEMTGDYKIILPLMMSCIMSSLASGQLLKESIYTLKLSRRGVNIKAGKEVNVLRSIPVREVMNPHVETLPDNITLRGLAEKISKSKYKSFPVVDEKENLTGVLTHYDYRDVVFNEDLKDLIVAQELATTQPVTVSLDDDLYTAMEKITLRDFSILPVVSPNEPSQLMGVLSRRDIISAYNKAVIKKFTFK